MQLKNNTCIVIIVTDVIIVKVRRNSRKRRPFYIPTHSPTITGRRPGMLSLPWPGKVSTKSTDGMINACQLKGSHSVVTIHSSRYRFSPPKFWEGA